MEIRTLSRKKLTTDSKQLHLRLSKLSLKMTIYIRIVMRILMTCALSQVGRPLAIKKTMTIETFSSISKICMTIVVFCPMKIT